MEISSILIKPIITEKSMSDAQKGVYTFKVKKEAKKPEVKKAIENQFKVKVLSVKTLIVKGKIRLTGRLRKKTKKSDYKKAKVQLPAGQKIDIFEIGK